jgi:hypothetical protein
MRSSNDDVEGCYDEAKEDNVGVNMTEFSCDLQQVCENSGNQLKVLFPLCLGLCLPETDDSPLFENKPWSPLPKTDTHPVNVEFAKDMEQQARLVLCLHPTPRPLNWPTSKGAH